MTKLTLHAAEAKSQKRRRRRPIANQGRAARLLQEEAEAEEAVEEAKAALAEIAETGTAEEVAAAEAEFKQQRAS